MDVKIGVGGPKKKTKRRPRSKEISVVLVVAGAALSIFRVLSNKSDA